MTTNSITPVDSPSQQSISPDTDSGFNKSFVTTLGQLQNVAKNALNPHFRNRYASLDAILDAVRPILASNGLCLSQEPIFVEGKAGVTTRVIHSSGETRESTLFLPLKDQTAQGVGSALTYARRYAISSILGIAADDDDDVAEASQPQKPNITVKKKDSEVPAHPSISPIDALSSIMWDNSIDDAHVIEFLLAKKAIKSRNVLLKDLSENIIKRLVETFDDVKAFKPAE